HSLAGEKVVEVLDFQMQKALTPEGLVLRSLPQAVSNVMQFVTEAGSRVTVRPSGTEPKIKCYASVSEPWDGSESHDDVMARLQERVKAHFRALGVT
ncbi:MAG: phospho-sugar mutase, partial [Flavobacteriales bacterium]|nr:phospho-sugar mutase [Flavobacteriales bacterium]